MSVFQPVVIEQFSFIDVAYNVLLVALGYTLSLSTYHLTNKTTAYFFDKEVNLSQAWLEWTIIMLMGLLILFILYRLHLVRSRWTKKRKGNPE